MSQHIAYHQEKKPTKHSWNFDFPALISGPVLKDTELDLEYYEGKCYSFILEGFALLFFALSVTHWFPEIAGMVLSYASIALFCVAPVQNLLLNARNGRYFSEAAVLLFTVVLMLVMQKQTVLLVFLAFYHAVKFYQGWVIRKQHEKIRGLQEILPDSANVVIGGEVRKMKLHHLQPEDVVLVAPGETVPVDGIVLSGMTELDEFALRKRNQTQTVSEGMPVRSGTINLSNQILVKATSSGQNSTAQRILSAFARSVKSETEEERKAPMANSALVAIALLLALITGAVIPLFSKNWLRGGETALLLILCSCPLGLFTILDLLKCVAMQRIFAAGAVANNAELLNELDSVHMAIFNKTATVTENQYKVLTIHPQNMDETSFLSIVGKIESNAPEGPIRSAILSYAALDSEERYDGVIVESVEGKGLSAKVGNHQIYIGNALLLLDHGFDCSANPGQDTIIHIAVNDTYCGYLTLENKTRQDSFDALAKLRRMDFKTLVMLSKDLISVVRPIASALSFDIVKAELTEEKKCTAVKYLHSNQQKNAKILYVGNRHDESEAAKEADLQACTDYLQTDSAYTETDLALLDEGIAVLPEVFSAVKWYKRLAKICCCVNLGGRGLLMLLALMHLCPTILGVLLVILLLFAMFFAANTSVRGGKA